MNKVELINKLDELSIKVDNLSISLTEALDEAKDIQKYFENNIPSDASDIEDDEDEK